MAFNSPTIASANVRGEGSSKFFKNKRDLVISVTGFNLERSTISGYTSDGRYVEAHVAPSDIARNRGYANTPEAQEKADKAPYLSHEINAKMKSVINPDSGNHLAVLHGAVVERKINKTVVTSRGTETSFRLIECSRVTDGGIDPEKTFEALVTITKNAGRNKVDRIQAWNPDAFSANDTTSLQNLAADFDHFANAQAKSQENAPNGASQTFYLPATGAEFRTIRMSNNPIEGGKIIDLSGRMEKSAAVLHKDTGAVITPSGPCTGALFLENAAAYASYVKGKYGENVRVEVAHYLSYPAGAKNNDFDFSMSKSAFSPMIQMANAQSKRADDDTSTTEGGNYGGWGVLVLAKDKKVEGTDDVVKMNFVNSLFVGTNSRGFIHKKVKSTDGQTYDLDDSLKGNVLKYNDTQHTPANTIPGGFKPSASQTPAHPANFQRSHEQDIPFAALSTTRPGTVSTQTPPAQYSNHQPANSNNGGQTGPGSAADVPFDDDYDIPTGNPTPPRRSF